MNKICIDNNLIIEENKTYFIKIENEELIKINVLDNVNAKIVIYSNNINYDLNINLAYNSNLVINSLNNNLSNKTIINLNDNASIIYNYSIINKEDCFSKIYLNHLASNTKSIVNNNGINLTNRDLFFEIDGIVKKDIINCETSQFSKIINYQDGNSKIIPNLIIDNNEVIANHSAYIGNFSFDDMFYIQSRGINKREMYRLLYRSLLLGKMVLDEEEELFNKLLKEWGVL